MKYSLNPLRYVPVFADLYGLLDFLRFQKQLLMSKYNIYKTESGYLLMAKDAWAKETPKK